jgi:16S rRNA processing protein RimM
MGAARTTHRELPEDAVALGRLLRAHGLKGEMKFLPFGCDRDLLLKIPDVLLGSDAQKVRVKGVRGAAKSWIESRDQAESLGGLMVWIRENQLPALAPSELYVASVMDAEVRDESGGKTGNVTDVLETAENDVLVVKWDDGQEELIPALRSVLAGWDAEGRVLTVRWPMGEGS